MKIGGKLIISFQGFPINEKKIENNLEMTPLRRLTKIKNVNSLKADGSSTMTYGRQTQSKTQNVTMPTTQNVTTQLGNLLSMKFQDLMIDILPSYLKLKQF